MKSPWEGADDKVREHGRFPGWAPWGSGKPWPQVRGPARHCVTSVQKKKALLSPAGLQRASHDKPLCWTSSLELKLPGRNEAGDSGWLEEGMASKFWTKPCSFHSLASVWTRQSTHVARDDSLVWAGHLEKPSQTAAVNHVATSLHKYHSSQGAKSDLSGSFQHTLIVGAGERCPKALKAEPGFPKEERGRHFFEEGSQPTPGASGSSRCLWVLQGAGALGQLSALPPASVFRNGNHGEVQAGDKKSSSLSPPWPSPSPHASLDRKL